MINKIEYVATGVATGKTQSTLKYINKQVSHPVVVVLPTLVMVKHWEKNLSKDKEIVIVTSDNDIDYSEFSERKITGMNVVQQLGAIVENPSNWDRNIVILTTHKTFLTYLPSKFGCQHWEVIIDECPNVFSTIDASTRDMTNTKWVEEYVTFTKSGEMFKVNLTKNRDCHDSVYNIIHGTNEEDKQRRKILAPVFYNNMFDVYSRKSEFVATDGKTMDIDFYILPKKDYFLFWKRVTVLAADFLDKEFYFHYKNQGLEFEVNQAIVDLIPEEALSRTYENMRIVYLSDKETPLSKHDFVKDSDLSDKINAAIVNLVGTNSFLLTRNKKESAFCVDHSKFLPDQFYEVSSSSHGINNPAWMDCYYTVYLSAINDNSIVSKAKQMLMSVTKEQIQTSMSNTTAYQTVGRCAVRTNAYKDKDLVFIVFNKDQAEFLSSKFKNSTVEKYIMPIKVETTDQSKKKYQEKREKALAKKFKIHSEKVKAAFGLSIDPMYFGKSKTASERQIKTTLMRMHTRDGRIDYKTLWPKQLEYFNRYPYEFVDCIVFMG